MTMDVSIGSSGTDRLGPLPGWVFRVVNPPAKFSRCLDDLADCLADAIRRAGFEAERATECCGLFGAFDVVLGAHSREWNPPPTPHIIYQTELPSSKWWTPNYVARLYGALAVWDAGPFHYDLPPHIKRATLEPGLVECTPADVPKDIDVLFYGSLSDRRVKILTELWDAGIKVETHFNVFGKERDALIDRAKIVIDIKQNDGDPDDSTRTFWLDSRGACVLSENAQRVWEGDRLIPERVVSQTKALLSSAHDRQQLTARRQIALGSGMDARQAIADVLRQPGNIAEALQAAQ